MCEIAPVTRTSHLGIDRNVVCLATPFTPAGEAPSIEIVSSRSDSQFSSRNAAEMIRLRFAENRIRCEINLNVVPHARLRTSPRLVPLTGTAFSYPLEK
jgi:hypothetical protein